MSYNFDPERWLDNEMAALEAAFNTGKLNATDYEKQSDALMERYDAMLARLDGTYQVNKNQ